MKLRALITGRQSLANYDAREYNTRDPVKAGYTNATTVVRTLSLESRLTCIYRRSRGDRECKGTRTVHLRALDTISCGCWRILDQEIDLMRAAMPIRAVHHPKLASMGRKVGLHSR